MTAVRMRGAAAALVLLTAFALAGCGDDEADQAAGSGAGAGSSADASDADANPDAEPDSDAEDADVDAEVVDVEENLVGEACLYGNWVFDNESFKETLEQAGGEVRSVEGLVMISYRQDGTTTSSFHDWTTVIVSPDADGGTATMVRIGEDLGTYTVSGDTLTTTETEPDSVLTMTMVVDGQKVSFTPPHEPFVSIGANFTCEGDTLTITAEGATSRLSREH